MVGNNTEDFEDVCRTIKCLIIAQKEWMTLEQLRKEYRDIEGRDIPFHQYGYSNIRTFLKAINKYVILENINGIEYVFQVESEKTAHISKLVSQQRSSNKKTSRNPRRGGIQYRPSRVYPVGGSTRCRVSAEELKSILNMIKHHPQGLSKTQLFQQIHEKNRYSQITLSDLEQQLRELSHEIRFENNLLFPRVPNKSTAPNFVSPLVPHQVTKNQASYRSYSNSTNHSKNIMPAGYEDEADLMDEEDYMFDNIKYDSNESQNQENNSNQQLINNHDSTIAQDNGTMDYDNMDDSNLVNDRTKFRLEKLIQKYEDGIWCAELPALYDKEYNVTLNYMDLGFESVREIAAYLKDIFVLEQPKERGDFKLYYVKTYKKKSNSEPIQKQTLASIHNIYDTEEVREPAVPERLTKETCTRLIPDDVLTYRETVGQISVTDIKENDPVIVSEIFDPSFFWIQQIKKLDQFKNLMKSISEFYDEKYKLYLIPPIVLEKGVNVACKYRDIWHRGIVKSIRPDNYAYVLFYDYGTVQLISTEELCFLHRKFSNIPAIAVPCGIHNLQPAEDNRWSRWIVAEFAAIVLDKPYYVKIKSINEETNSAMVYLYNEQIDLRKWMIENAVAIESSVVCTSQITNYFLQIDPNCLRKKCSKSLSQDNHAPTNAPNTRRKRIMAFRTEALNAIETSESEVDNQSNIMKMRPNERVRLLFKNRSQSSAFSKPQNNTISSTVNHIESNSHKLQVFTSIDTKERNIDCPSELVNLHTILGSKDTHIDWDKLLHSKNNGEKVAPEPAQDVQKHTHRTTVQKNLKILTNNDYFSRAIKCDRFYTMSKRNTCWSTKFNLKQFQNNILPPLELTQRKKKCLPENVKLGVPVQLIELIKSKSKKHDPTIKSKNYLQDNNQTSDETARKSNIHSNDRLENEETNSVCSTHSSSQANSDVVNSIMKSSQSLFNKFESKKPLIEELNSYDFTPEEIKKNELCKLDSSNLLTKINENSTISKQSLTNASKNCIKEMLTKLHNIADNITETKSLDSDDISTLQNSDEHSIADNSDISSYSQALIPINTNNDESQEQNYNSDEMRNSNCIEQKSSKSTSEECQLNSDEWDIVGQLEDFFNPEVYYHNLEQMAACKQNSVVISEVTEDLKDNSSINNTSINCSFETSEAVSTDSLQASVSSNLDTDTDLESSFNSSSKITNVNNAKEIVEKCSHTVIFDEEWEPAGKTKSLLQTIQKLKMSK